MTYLNITFKDISMEDRKASGNNLSKLLAESFNGEVIQVDGEYIHES